MDEKRDGARLARLGDGEGEGRIARGAVDACHVALRPVRSQRPVLCDMASLENAISASDAKGVTVKNDSRPQ